MSSSDRGSGPHGLLIVDKPEGPTSHDIVSAARRLLGTRRVGHAGTLDPMATGVLVLLLGEATKLSDLATAADKVYRATVSFGRATDSHDAQGSTTLESDVNLSQLSDAALHGALEAERQRTLQVPPLVSAIKLQGRRAYALARAGATPELAPRPVRVQQLSVLQRGEQTLSLELRVSKGYYVRALARDLGLALGFPAHLSQLRRIASGAFSLSEACSWPPPLPAPVQDLAPCLPRLMPTLHLTEAGVRRARAGQPLSSADFADTPPGDELAHVPTTCAWVDPGGLPVALGARVGDVFRVRRGFASNCGVTTR
jgi:tRNA pseudouridine55 synthase